jgi:hypothetical protein
MQSSDLSKSVNTKRLTTRFAFLFFLPQQLIKSDLEDQLDSGTKFLSFIYDRLSQIGAMIVVTATMIITVV